MSKVVFKRTFTEDQRVAFVNEALESGSNILVAKKHNINQVLLSTWISNYRRYGQTLKPKEPKDKDVIPNYKKDYQKLKSENDDLKLKISILEDLLKKNNQH